MGRKIAPSNWRLRSALVREPQTKLLAVMPPVLTPSTQLERYSDSRAVVPEQPAISHGRFCAMTARNKPILGASRAAQSKSK
jgi:hypothetical protein